MKRTAIDLHHGIAASAAVLVFASAAWACDSKPTACSAAAEKSTAQAPAAPACHSAVVVDQATVASDKAVVDAGMRVYLDPETGTLSPVPTTVEDAVVAQPEALAEPVKTVLPDGSIMMELNGHNQEYFTVELGPDGKPVAKCSQNHDHKTDVTTPAPAAKPEER
jgi:hypothetical protein